jgi:hypothetical protein
MVTENFSKYNRSESLPQYLPKLELPIVIRRDIVFDTIFLSIRKPGGLEGTNTWSLKHFTSWTLQVTHISQKTLKFLFGVPMQTNKCF